MNPINDIDVATLIDLQNRVHLVDVREKEEFDQGHIEGAILHPLSSFTPDKLPQDKPLVFYCRSGNRSRIAASRCPQSCYNLKGGFLAWSAYHRS